MTETLRPRTPAEVEEAVRWAAAEEAPLEVVAGASKRAYGRPCEASARLELAGLAGVSLYEPAELVMTAAAATPLAEIEALLAEHRQRLDFEPADLGPLLGGAAGRATIGGVIACNLAGPRRIKAGAARDHILGFRAVSGRGETFKSGGRVVKNVTGFDLSKLMAGSFGTLAVLTEVTVKVLPAADATRTVVVLGLADEAAVKAMTAALQAPCEVSAAAHLPAALAAASAVASVAGAAAAVTAIRIEGPPPSVEFRTRELRALLADFGETGELAENDSIGLWREVRDVACFRSSEDRPLWRLSVAPASGARVAAAVLGELEGRVYYDWGGGLLWLELAPTDGAGHQAVRRAVAAVGGHATLVRAAAEVRAAVPVFQPEPPPLAALSARVKEGFDPRRILNRGRMVAGV